METITVNGKVYYSEKQHDFDFNFDVVERRFLSNVKKTNKCWNWIGSTSNNYGRFGINNKRILAHRFSYMIYKGSIYGNNVINHICRNKLCINPKHLEQVNSKQNTIFYYNGSNSSYGF